MPLSHCAQPQYQATLTHLVPVSRHATTTLVVLESFSKLLRRYYYSTLLDQVVTTCASTMDHRIEEVDESGSLTAIYVESSSNGRQRIDVIVSRRWEGSARPSHHEYGSTYRRLTISPQVTREARQVMVSNSWCVPTRWISPQCVRISGPLIAPCALVFGVQNKSSDSST